ncbi:acylphosphatase [Sphingomonas immobilis]|uniref:acylphosphatase n=1 Tax=Sphingomonas immobilis TaxID=3063997 RepID=A0ABT8ZY02_9SPHN|nr:acylphosphatase [Sphingomonas sp. CA1-15]MDO7841357.1 acylphosphatase [Sphingomonas sp. CA1-15]
MIRRHLLITGRVQNVFYRDWMVEQAAALGIDGWVRNRADGSVEAVVAGASELVETLIVRCREGSPASRVAEVIVTPDESGAVYERFEKRATI